MSTAEPEPEKPDDLDEEREPGFWNVWRVLSVIFLGVGLFAVVGEYLGWFRDLGLVIGIFGLALSTWFGITAATQQTSGAIRFDIRRLRLDVARGFDTQTQALTRAGERQAERLGDRLSEPLGRIETLLRDRLPRP